MVMEGYSLKQKNAVFTQKVLYSYKKRIKIVSTSGSNKRRGRLLLDAEGNRCCITVHQMKIFRKKEVAWRERRLFGLDC